VTRVVRLEEGFVGSLGGEAFWSSNGEGKQEISGNGGRGKKKSPDVILGTQKREKIQQKQKEKSQHGGKNGSKASHVQSQA